VLDHWKVLNRDWEVRVRHVRGWVLVASVALSVGVLCGAVAKAAAPEVQKNGLAYAKGHTAGHGNSSRALLLYHSGGVMTTGATVKAIFWGNWSNPGDKISGIDAFYRGISNSAYLKSTTEYTQSGGAHVSAAVSPQGYVIDSSATPSKDPGTSGVLAEVAKMIGSSAVVNGYYPVYTDIPRGSAGYCAWHSWGSVGSTPVQFAFFFKLDGDAGCDPADPGAVHSQGLEAIANVSGHELSEALTDPRGAGWFDRQGAENSDKCAWTFGGNVTIGGQSWKIQGNFSNNAYNARSGYDGGGCIQTG
jgi:hypothetical protein